MKTKLLFLFSYTRPPKRIFKNAVKLFSVKTIWADDDNILEFIPPELIGWADIIISQEVFLKKVSCNKIINYSDFQKSYTTKDFYPLKKINEDSKIAFFCSNDTHVWSFLQIAKYFSSCLFFVPAGRSEGAEKLLKEHGLNSEKFGKNALRLSKCDILLFANDWGFAEKVAIRDARKLNIPTVCLQEGPLDFNDILHRRMSWADFSFMQGPLHIKYLDRSCYFLTGNPRFDILKNKNINNNKLVMANLNFTYGVEEQHRERWLKDVVEVCTELDVPFFLSQHPRDMSRFEGLPLKKSSATTLKQQFSTASILISRFSALIYEALFAGLQVIYYNPHREKMRLFRDEDSTVICKAQDKIELKNALFLIVHGKRKILNRQLDIFIKRHCLAQDHRSGERCVNALKLVFRLYSTLKPSDFYQLRWHEVFLWKCKALVKKLIFFKKTKIEF